MMPTNWLFWLNASLSFFGLLIILYGVIAKRNLRGKRFNKQTPAGAFPYYSVVEGVLALLVLILTALTLSIVVERRNYARAIAAQNAQTSPETDEEVG